MSWIFNSIRVYADKLESKTQKVIARLQPLAGSTILHVFGDESEIVTFGGLVVTDTDNDALKALVTTSTSYTLSGPEGIVGDFYIKNLASKRTPIVNICLDDRPGLPEDSPVYEVSMELYIDA